MTTLELFPFQKEGSTFLQNKTHALLGDQPGVGKTPQAIDAALTLNLKKILVVVPSVAKYNWEAEFMRFGGKPSWVAGDGDTFHDKPLCITSFNYAHKHLNLYSKVKWDVVIVDEVHKLKEPTAQRTKALLGNDGLVHSSKRFWALSGTPAPNHAGELWVLFYTFGVTKLSYQGFIARYCNTYQNFGGIQITGSKTKYSHELRAMLAKVMLRRLKKDVLDLPPLFHNTYYIKGDTTDVLKNLPELKKKLKAELAALSERLNFFMPTPDGDTQLIAMLSMMSQGVSSVRRYHGLKKVKPVIELISSELKAQDYRKILIFGHHGDVLAAVRNGLEENGFKSVIAFGGRTAKQKFQAQEDFQNDPSIQAFIGNIEAAGTNLTLTKANQVLFIEQDWVPGNNSQAADRAHRFGQTESVTVRHIAIKDSIDAKITSALARKTQEIASFLD